MTLSFPKLMGQRCSQDSHAITGCQCFKDGSPQAVKKGAARAQLLHNPLDAALAAPVAHCDAELPYDVGVPQLVSDLSLLQQLIDPGWPQLVSLHIRG